MPIGTSDGEYFDNKFEAMVGSGVTAGLRRIPIVKDPEVSPGIDPGDDSMVVSPERLQMGKQLDQAEVDPSTGMGLNISSSTDSTMPLGASRKPAGEFKSEEGTRVAPPNNFDLSSNVDWSKMNQPLGELKGTAPEDTPIVYKHPTNPLLDMREGEIARATEVALGATTGPIASKNKAYIDMFVNKAKAEPVPYSALKDKPVKPAKYGLDYEQMGNGKYEVFDPITGKTHATVDNEQTAKYLAKEFNPQTLNPTPKATFEGSNAEAAAKFKQEFEQVPFGYSEGEWALMSPYQKKKVLDNPPAGGAHPKEGLYLDEKGMPIYDGKGHPVMKEDVPGTPEFDKKYGYNQPPVDNNAKIMAEIEKVLNELDNLPKGKKVPITESGRLEKLSPKEAFKQGFQSAKDQLTDDLNLIAAKFKKALTGPPAEIPPPKVSGKGDYTEPAYRGLSVYDQPGMTTNPVYKFTEEGAMYSTAHPMLADMYAGYLNSHPGVKVPEGTFPAGAQVMPLLINPKEYHYFDAKGEIWQKANPKAINEAKDMGKKGVIVDNVWDEPNSTKALAKPNKIYITFPKGAGTVKSRFATKFDESSPNIMHGIATVGIGTAATGYLATEEQPPNL